MYFDISKSAKSERFSAVSRGFSAVSRGSLNFRLFREDALYMAGLHTFDVEFSTEVLKLKKKNTSLQHVLEMSYFSIPVLFL